MATFLLTGGAGFNDSAFVRELRRMGFIDDSQPGKLADAMGASAYATCFRGLREEEGPR